MEEVVDTLKAALFLPAVKGNRVAAVGGSGGGSVAVSDAFAEAGLRVPPLSRASYEEFASFWLNIGGGYKNPVDTYNPNRREMKRILDILVRDTSTDNIVALFAPRHAGPGGQNPVDVQLAPFADLTTRTAKPVMACITGSSSPETAQAALELMGRLQTIGIPAFLGMERGALALRNALALTAMRQD
jgi:acyl-CoA synthetase (NDP forming)